MKNETKLLTKELQKWNHYRFKEDFTRLVLQKVKEISQETDNLYNELYKNFRKAAIISIAASLIIILSSFILNHSIDPFNETQLELSYLSYSNINLEE